MGGAHTIHKSGDLEVMVVSDGNFVLPTGFRIARDSPPPRRTRPCKRQGRLATCSSSSTMSS